MTAVGDVFLLTAFGRAFAQRIMLTMTYKVSAQVAAVDDAAAALSLTQNARGGLLGVDLLETKYLNLLPPQYSLSFWQAQKVHPTRLAYQFVPRGTPGLHANAARTSNQAAVITLQTANAGRNQQANKHIGPIPEGAAVQVAGEIAGAYLALLETFKDAMVAPIVDAISNITWQPIIFHGPVPFPAPDDITHGVRQDTVRVMRRRTVSVGE